MSKLDIGVELNKIEHEDCYTYLERVKDKSIDTVISDVPYNISGNELDENGNEVKIEKSKGNPYMNGKVGLDFGDWDKGDFIVEDWIKAVTPKVKDNGQIIIFNSFKNMEKMARTLRDEGWTVMGMYYWFKPNPVPHMPKLWALNSFEQYLWAVKDPNDYTFNVREHAKTEPTVSLVGKKVRKKYKPAIYEKGRIEASHFEEANKRFHTTQKPISMWTQIVEVHSNVGDIVLDSFSGSGVNAVACIETYRNFIGTELDDDYFVKSTERIKREQGKSKKSIESVIKSSDIYFDRKNK